MKLLSLFAATALTVTGFLYAGNDASAAASKTTTDFVTNAAIGSMFEIESSKLALEKSENTEVKTFAKQMIEDHNKAMEHLKATLLSSTADASLANQKLDNKHQSILEKLKDAYGADFDKKYIATQKDAHNDAISVFSNYTKNGDDTALKEYANKTLPTLEKHQKHAQSLK